MYFPTLSIDGPDFPVGQESSSAGDLVSPTEGGYKISRKQFTRSPKTFSAPYRMMSDADNALLEQFIDTVGTTMNFTWIHPRTMNSHDVRFTRRPKLTLFEDGWGMDAIMEEV